MNLEASEEATALRPVQRVRLYEELAEKLLDYVTEVELKPGDRLPAERVLAERLQVSRATVRQATVALEVQGIVEVRHGDGMYLLRTERSKGSLQQLLDRRTRLPEVLEARETLECQFAALAARRHSKEDLVAIKAALVSMENEIAAGGIGENGDAAFHRAVAQAAKNSVLLHLMDVLAPAVHDTRIESLSEPGRPLESLRLHQLIADAVEAGEPRRAAAAMRRHLRSVANVRLLRWNP